MKRGTIFLVGTTLVTGLGIAYIHHGQKVEREVWVTIDILYVFDDSCDCDWAQNLHKGVIRDKELYKRKLAEMQHKKVG